MEKKHRNRDGGWGWVIVFCSFMNHLLLEGCIRSYGLIYLALLERFNQGSAVTTWLHAVFMGLQQLGVGPFLGILVDRFTCRWLVVTGGVLLSASFLLSAFAPNLYFLYFSYSLLGGIGSGLIYSPIVIIVNDYFEKKRGKAMGMAALGAAGGTFAMPPLMMYLFHHYSYTGCLMILGGIVLNHCVFAGFYRQVKTTPVLEICVEVDKKRMSTQKEYISQEITGDNNISQELNCDNKLSERQLNNEYPGSINNHECCTKMSDLQSGNSINSIHGVTGSKSFGEAVVHYRNGIPTPGELDTGEKYTLELALQNQQSKENRQLVTANEQISEETSSNGKRLRMVTERCSILRNVSFLFYCFLMFTIPSANTAVFVFLPGLAEERGVSDNKAALLISIIGVSNVFGTISIGFIFDIPFVRRHRRVFHGVLAFTLGLSVITMAVIHIFVAMAIVAGFYGFILAGVMGQRATALSQYVDAEKLPFAFGFTIVFQGLGNLAGPTLQGYLKDSFSTHSACFYYGGSLIGLSSTLLIGDYIVRTAIRARKEKNTQTISKQLDDL